MRRSFAVLAGASAALAAVPAADAVAASSKVVPTITKVAPMRVQVGKTITVRGRHFDRSAKGNTVLFKGTAGRSVLAKPTKASTTRLVVKVPRGAERILTQKAGSGIPTRIRLRVITKRYGAVSNTRQSPVVVSALAAGEPLQSPTTPRSGSGTTTGKPSSRPGSGAIGAPCGTGSDWDGDLLSNDLELAYALNPCSADSDADGLTDGWEYWSAKDLNVRAVPYPGKKPYPNPLDGSDANIDFDGDSLTAVNEYRAWVYTGRAFDPANPYSPLGYSDGTQTSRPTSVPPTPAFRSAALGQAYTPPSYPTVYDTDQNGSYSDEERDADVDGLSNYIEAAGPGSAGWWTGVLNRLSIEEWPGTNPSQNYSYYGAFKQRPFADTNIVDPDVDGDTLLDGEDDQDNDSIPNTTEMYDPLGTVSIGGQTRNKNAFNPCAPDTRSRTCPRYFPVN